MIELAAWAISKAGSGLISLKIYKIAVVHKTETPDMLFATQREWNFQRGKPFHQFRCETPASIMYSSAFIQVPKRKACRVKGPVHIRSAYFDTSRGVHFLVKRVQGKRSLVMLRCWRWGWNTPRRASNENGRLYNRAWPGLSQIRDGFGKCCANGCF